MRYIIFILLLVVCSCNYLIKPKSKIVDNAFAEAIRRQCSACIDTANYLTPSADTLTVLNINRGTAEEEQQPAISSLEGFNFKNLVEFSCFNNEISTLPNNLPSGLLMLNCSKNKITVLPEVSLNKLESFYCFENKITQIPKGYLPNSLRILTCDDNDITSLPDVSLDKLTEFKCARNAIKEIPAGYFPNTLTHIHCNSNQLTTLPPKMPASLRVMQCGGNKLTGLPQFSPNFNILTIDADLKQYVADDAPFKVFIGKEEEEGNF